MGLSGFFVHGSAEIDDAVTIGAGTKIWHFSHLLKNTVVGEGCNIGQNVVAGPDVRIGNNCKIQNNVSVYKGVTLEDDVFCGPSMVFTNVFNPRSHVRRMDEIRPTLVKKGASLGANSTIVCGVTIGRFALVGAGAVVTRDVPDHALVMGNPARQTGWMCECGEKLDGGLCCPVCKKEFTWLEPKGSIAFVDLSAQQRRILPAIEAGIRGVLKHGNYIMGPEVKTLEGRLAEFVGVKHAVGCASGTDALVMALMGLGVGAGDAVFTSSFTFIATAEAIRFVGATPVFVDVDPVTFNLSLEKLEQAIESVVKEGRLRPRAVMPVDLFGLTCDYDAIDGLAATHDLFVIEDAAQSFGAVYKGRRAGGFGHAGCTSFFPAKPLGCYGDGGAVFTDSDELAERLVSIRVHGKGTDKYDNVRLGLNGRLDTLQAAILLPKLDIFPDELERRQVVADRYTRLLAGTGLVLPHVPPGYASAWAQYSILAADGDARAELQARLKENGIPSAVYYPTPLHLQTAFADLGYGAGDLPVSEDLSRRIMSLPMHPYLTEAEQQAVAAAVAG